MNLLLIPGLLCDDAAWLRIAVAAPACTAGAGA